jgi:hypothetical protein
MMQKVIYIAILKLMEHIVPVYRRRDALGIEQIKKLRTD